MTHKEMAAHIRKRLKVEGIKSRVRKYVACGTKYIAVSMDTDRFHNAREWSPEEAYMIGFIAKCNKLTGARGTEIDLDVCRQMTGKVQFDFEYYGD